MRTGAFIGSVAGIRQLACPCSLEILIVPFKVNTAHRHHLPKQRHRVTNSAIYDAALCQRGSLTVWFTDAAIAA